VCGLRSSDRVPPYDECSFPGSFSVGDAPRIETVHPFTIDYKMMRHRLT
jgi:hypothetical protein